MAGGTKERGGASLSLNTYLKNTIDRQSKPISARARYSMAALDLAIEHHGSMGRLVVEELYGSAYALLRPLIEAEVAGRWLAFCVTDQQGETFRKNGFCPKPELMLKQLEKRIRKEDRIQTLLTGEGRVLHDFTHGGLEQWERRIFGSEWVKASYAPAEINGVLTIADLFAVLSALGIAFGCGKSDLVDELVGRVNAMRSAIESATDCVYPKKLRHRH